ncbi:MAG: hypothetical protein H6Q16_794 [Bacteroidetes bacterium]|nr:hypothetical protein [Bacteroidota bacterium]
MRDVKEKFRSYSLLKKILFFNTYAIGLGSLYFIIMIIISPLFDTMCDDRWVMDYVILYLKDSGSYIQAAAWGYLMAAFALFTPIFSGNKKK